jgi:hypothetical protein
MYHCDHPVFYNISITEVAINPTSYGKFFIIVCGVDVNR